MMKTKSLEMARENAISRGLRVGLCVFDGFYYVGDIQQLSKIGCVLTVGRRSDEPNERRCAHVPTGSTDYCD